MKRIIALALCAAFIFLCSCSDKEYNAPVTDSVNYVNGDEWTGIGREMVTDWFDGAVDGVTQNDLPADFPSVPDETSNISIKKRTPQDTAAGYTSDWIELVFSAPRQSVNKFSDDLRKAGYKGVARYLPVSGWQGAWQNGKHFVRIASWEYEYDGSYIITVHITECRKSTHPELEAVVPMFNGFSATEGSYFELINGGAKRHDFDGSFHAEWQLEYSGSGTIAGTNQDEFDSYVETLNKNGFIGQRSFYNSADECIVYVYEGYNKETGITVAAFLNESLMTLEIRYTNVTPEITETETSAETVTEQ